MWLLRTLKLITRVAYAACVLEATSYAVTFHRLEGPSMLPTFNVYNDVTVAEHLTPMYRDVQLGDVVMAQSPNDSRRYVCKRVVGLPGDIVCADPSLADSPMVHVPAGHYWLQGDNFRNSTDSRQYGPVPFGLIRGRIIMRIFPFHKACWIGQNRNEL